MAAQVSTPTELVRSPKYALRIVADLKRDGLFENEVADMIGVPAATLSNWKHNGTTPKPEPFAKLVSLHKARGLSTSKK